MMKIQKRQTKVLDSLSFYIIMANLSLINLLSKGRTDPDS